MVNHTLHEMAKLEEKVNTKYLWLNLMHLFQYYLEDKFYTGILQTCIYHAVHASIYMKSKGCQRATHPLPNRLLHHDKAAYINIYFWLPSHFERKCCLKIWLFWRKVYELQHVTPQKRNYCKCLPVKIFTPIILL